MTTETLKNSNHSQSGLFHLRPVRKDDSEAVRQLFWDAIVIGPDAGPAIGRRAKLTDLLAAVLYLGMGLGIGINFLPKSIYDKSLLATKYALNISRLRLVGATFPLIALGILVARVRLVRRYFENHVRKAWNTELSDVYGYYMAGMSGSEKERVESDPKLLAQNARMFWVAESLDGKVVGCLGLDVDLQDPTNGSLRRMAVSSNHRRMGIGKALILTAIERAKSFGVKELHVVTSIYNKSGMGIYEKTGFVESERDRTTNEMGWGFKIAILKYWYRNY